MHRDTVSAEQLRQGAWCALRQAGRLLHSATVVADDGDPITGSGLAMFGREELGRSRILRNLADKVDAGESLETKDVRHACDDHVSKQSAGSFSTTLTAEPPSRLNSVLRKRLGASPGSKEWHAATDAADMATDAKRKRSPQRRHSIRVRGFYVDLNDAGTGWIEPCAQNAQEARSEITEAVNDYAAERDRLRDQVLDTDFPEMARARSSILSRVALPAPRWPSDPKSETDTEAGSAARSGPGAPGPAYTRRSAAIPTLTGNQMDARKYGGLAKLGVVLMGLSLGLWVALLLVPFLPITAAAKMGLAGAQIVVAEVAFWGGAALAGPAAARRMKSWWRSSRADEAN